MTPATPTVDLPPRFRVSSHVATGGMASVWAAEDVTLARLVAIKLLGEQFLGDPDAARRFQREARAQASLSNHPHVVTIYDVGEHEGRPFIVMEYMSGGSLSDGLRNGPPSRREAVGWLEEAAQALDAAHERGIVHRDVKPANLLLDDRRRLAVADFGIARLAFDTTLTGTGQVIGTAAYLSPEQAEGASANAASDRYALAVVGYELLTGRRPFEAPNFAAQARQHAEADPAPPSEHAADLSPAVDAALLRGLAKRPEDRWPTAGEMVRALDGALGDAADPTETTMVLAPTAATERMAPASRPTRKPLPSPAAPPRPRPQPPRPVEARPPRRWPLIAGLAAAALLAILLVAGVFGGGDERSATKPQAPRSTSTSRSPAAAATTAGDAATADGRSATQLQREGHRLLASGRPGDAVPVLEAAVKRCGQSTVVDPCAYALYDLGRALRLSGRPREAIPILERRLQIPDQQDAVRRELELARQAAGASAPAPSQPGGGHGKGKHKRKHEGGDEGGD